VEKSSLLAQRVPKQSRGWLGLGQEISPLRLIARKKKRRGGGKVLKPAVERGTDWQTLIDFIIFMIKNNRQRETAHKKKARPEKGSRRDVEVGKGPLIMKVSLRSVGNTYRGS